MAQSVDVHQWRDRLEAAGLKVPRDLVEQMQGASSPARFEEFVQHLRQLGKLTDWQAGELLRGRKRFLIGKYRLLRTLGRGGMGEVYLAEHVTMERRVAIKLIDSALPPEALERFLSEVRTIAALDHPNIVHAYNVDLDEGRYYLVMEYVEGTDLEQLVQTEGPLDWRRAARLLRQAAMALAYAHEKGIVHCDIKPANLMVTSSEVLKVLDLGLARLYTPGSGTQRSDTRVVGTVDYMAPEFALHPDQIDYRADIYSLGCVLYYTLTGRPPFAGGTLSERILKHQVAPPPDLRKIRPDVPEELGAIYRQCLAKQPEQRPGSAEELAASLKACYEKSPSGLIRARALPVATAVEDGSADTVARPVKGDLSPASGELNKDSGAQKLSKWGNCGRLMSLLKHPAVLVTLIIIVVVTAVEVWLALQASNPSPYGPGTGSPKENLEKLPADAPPVGRPEDDPEEFRRRIEDWMRSQSVKQSLGTQAPSKKPNSQ